MPKKIYKTSVNLPQESVDALKTIAERSGSSMAEVLRRAIANEKFLTDSANEGNKILVENKKTKRISEIIIRR